MTRRIALLPFVGQISSRAALNVNVIPLWINFRCKSVCKSCVKMWKPGSTTWCLTLYGNLDCCSRPPTRISPSLSRNRFNSLIDELLATNWPFHSCLISSANTSACTILISFSLVFCNSKTVKVILMIHGSFERMFLKNHWQYPAFTCSWYES